MSKININDPTAWSQIDWDEPEQPELLKRTDQKVAVARSNRLTKTTKESRERQTIKNQILAKDPKWLKTTVKKNQELAKDPKWLAANQKGQEKRKAKAQELKANGDMEGFRKLFGVKDQHSKKTLKQMSASAIERWAKTMKKVHAQGKIYESIYTASDALGIHKDTVVYRIKSPNYPDFYYME